MIGFVKGKLDTVDLDRVLVENCGIGYEIFIPATMIERLPQVGNDVKIYTYTYVKEDVLALYGFLTSEELKFFKLLLTVSGVGPKGALGILSAMDVDTLRFAIISGDSKTIAKSPGIGKKTAEKLIIELKDKCSADDFITEMSGDSGVDNVISVGSLKSDAAKDAMEALTALGYSQTEAMNAVRNVEIKDGMTADDILKAGLKHL